MSRLPGRQAAAPRRAAYQRGRSAEFLAALALRAKGYRILARGYRCPAGEIDIIARRGALVAAVEVKARDTHEAAAEAIDARQRGRIERAMAAFVARNPACAQCQIRFDAMLVVPRRWPRHIADAWRPAG